MAEVLLSDYLAYLFSQISKARDMADRYSKEIALVYAKDDVLRHFSVPRFKLSKMDLTMPMMVSGVEVSSLMQFQMTGQDFRSFIIERLIAAIGLVVPIMPGMKDVARARDARSVSTSGLEPAIDVFYEQLSTTTDLSRPETVIGKHWPAIVERALSLNNIPSELTKLKPVADVLSRALTALTEALRGKIVVPKATIERLLINPETNVVKGGSSDATVFTIKAELIEEGLLIKQVRDDATGAESSVVEFE